MTQTEHIESVALHETTQRRYLNYALSVITSRALPDVRDGLKPVQRRIVYAMYHNLRLTHEAKHRKSAAVVGEVMAKYHPHGDQAIYDAMVRMAQPFSMRYPLVDGHGNFGSLDGDGAAAMRYTEARLQALSSELVSEIGKETVPLLPNYDAQFEEPSVLPAQLPNLLLNGATGIAVGLATNIPPHNLREVIDACRKLIKNPEATTADLVKNVKAPDFPTGGKLLNTAEELLDLYETGHGTVTMAGDWTEEREGRRRYVVITSVPYAINKATLVEKIGDHIAANKVPQLRDVRDESTDDVRIVCELSPNADAEVAMAYLYKNTPLSTKFHVNLNCLVPGAEPGSMVPARLSLREVLRHFLDFRLEVVTKRLEYDLRKVRQRIHILEAFEKVFGALDEAIALIRSADGRADARDKLMVRFELDEVQADAILDTRLYRLARLEIEAITTELAEKRAEAERLEALLADEQALWDLIDGELAALKKTYGDRRRTAITGPEHAVEFVAEDYIVSEDGFVIVTREGFIKRQRSYSDISTIRVRENDAVGWILQAMTTETVIFFTNHGRAFTTLADKIPATTGYGEPIQAHFDFADGERIVGIDSSDGRLLLPIPEEVSESLSEDDPEPPHLVAVTRAGSIVRFGRTGYDEPSTVAGRKYIRLSKKKVAERPDAVVAVLPCDGSENVAVASEKGRVLVFPIDQVPILKNPGRGVSAIKLAKDDAALGFGLLRDSGDLVEVETNRGRMERITARRYDARNRNNKGRLVLRRGYFKQVVTPTVERLEPEPDDPESPADEEGDDLDLDELALEPGSGDSGDGESADPQTSTGEDAVAVDGEVIAADTTGDDADAASASEPSDRPRQFAGFHPGATKSQTSLFGEADDDDEEGQP